MRTFKDASTAADFIANLVLDREFDSRNDASIVIAADYADGVQAAIRRLGITAQALPQGSIAKGTNLGGSDFDIFVLLPRDTTEDFSTVAMRIATEMVSSYASKATITPMIASHPYVVVRVGVTEMDIVPCYDVPATEIVSAVDRTPHHTRFMNENLSLAQKQDVRKLKLFMKGIGVYGADVWTGGYSGYACEVLVHTCGSFLGVLRAVSAAAPATLLDPVDANRNVLASVSDEKAMLFESCARAYMSNPGIQFFYPYKDNPELGDFNLLLSAPAADENAAAGLRSRIQGRVRTIQKQRPEFHVGGRYYWNNGMFYALFSSGPFPVAISRAGPPPSMKEAHAAWVAANSSIPDRVIDHSDNTVVILNRVRNVTELLHELGDGFMLTTDYSVLNGMERTTYPPSSKF